MEDGSRPAGGSSGCSRPGRSPAWAIACIARAIRRAVDDEAAEAAFAALGRAPWADGAAGLPDGARRPARGRGRVPGDVPGAGAAGRGRSGGGIRSARGCMASRCGRPTQARWRRPGGGPRAAARRTTATTDAEPSATAGRPMDWTGSSTRRSAACPSCTGGPSCSATWRA